MTFNSWWQEHMPSDKLLWRGSFYLQRDLFQYILSLFKVEGEVESVHTSKSILLPVLTIRTDSVLIRIRGNFHDYKVSVESTTPINLVTGLVSDGLHINIHPCHCEGFNPDWVHKCYSSNNCKFTVEVLDDYRLYTLMYLIVHNNELN